MGEDAFHPDIGGRQGVEPGQHLRSGQGRDEAAEIREIGAHVGDRGDADGKKAPVGVECELGIGDVVPALRVAEERLGALGRPLHRTAELARRVEDENELAVEEELHAETAADIRCDDADAILRCAEYASDRLAHEMRALRRGIERVALFALAPIADRIARLHRVGDQTVVAEPQRDDVLGACEGGVGRRLVADLPVEVEVVRRVLPDQRLARRQGCRRRDGSRQRLVIDGDELGRVLGLRRGLGDDEGDRIAGVTDAFRSENRVGRGPARAAVPVRQRRQ